MFVLLVIALVSLYLSQSNAYQCTLSPAASYNGWDYTTLTSASCSAQNPCGPTDWWKLTDTNGVSNNNCAGPNSGDSVLNTQSPVDFNSEGVLANPNIYFPADVSLYGGCSNWASFANDHYWEVSFSEASCSNLQVSFQGNTWQLIQLHFHSPSEHTVGGGRFDAELHMVHTRPGTTDKLVIGVFLDSSSQMIAGQTNNPLLNTFWTSAMQAANLDPETTTGISQALAVKCQWDIESGSPINPYKSILPASGQFYTYTGGLTTPPCSGGVTFVIPTDPVKISPTDLFNLRFSVGNYSNGADVSLVNQYGNEARPTQPLNQRVVTLGSSILQTSASPSAQPTPKTPSYSPTQSFRPTNEMTMKPTKTPTEMPTQSKSDAVLQETRVVAALGLAFSIFFGVLLVGFFCFFRSSSPVNGVSSIQMTDRK